MKVNFQAQIKTVTIKSLVSLDKSARIDLEFQPSDELIDKINRLHKPDSLINITIQEEEENGQY